jgi:hypothetical protein
MDIGAMRGVGGVVGATWGVTEVGKASDKGAV